MNEGESTDLTSLMDRMTDAKVVLRTHRFGPYFVEPVVAGELVLLHLVISTYDLYCLVRTQVSTRRTSLLSLRLI